MCKVRGELWQDLQASWQGVPHVLVPRYVREDAVLNDLGRMEEKTLISLSHFCFCIQTLWLSNTTFGLFLLSLWVRLLELNVKSTTTRDPMHLSLHIPVLILNDTVSVLSILHQQEVYVLQQHGRPP